MSIIPIPFIHKEQIAKEKKLAKQYKTFILQQQFKKQFNHKQKYEYFNLSQCVPNLNIAICHAITPQIAPHHPVFRRTGRLTHAS